MYRGFSIGGEWWHVRIVPPSSPFLIDRTGTLTVATTDAKAKCINVSSALHGEYLRRVLSHEITHTIMSIYGFNDRIRQLAKRNKYVDIEELICNIVADHGHDILSTAEQLFTSISTISSDNAIIAA